MRVKVNDSAQWSEAARLPQIKSGCHSCQCRVPAARQRRDKVLPLRGRAGPARPHCPAPPRPLMGSGSREAGLDGARAVCALLVLPWGRGDSAATWERGMVPSVYKASTLQEKPQTPALSHPMVLGITHRVRLEGTRGLTCSHCPAHPRAPGTALCPGSSTQHGPGPTRAALGHCASSSHAGAQHQLKAATSFPSPRWDLPGRAAPSPVLTLISPRTDHIVSGQLPS